MSSRTILAIAETLAARHPGTLIVRTQHCFARCQQDVCLCPSVCIDGEWLRDADEIKLKRLLRPRLEKLEAELGDSEDPFDRFLRRL